jgi:hypothetical protein
MDCITAKPLRAVNALIDLPARQVLPRDHLRNGRQLHSAFLASGRGCFVS